MNRFNFSQIKHDDFKLINSGIDLNLSTAIIYE